MKKWEKPELKVLGVENTLEGILPKHVEAGTGLVWICNKCKAHPVNDISDNGFGQVGNVCTSDTRCHCGSNEWVKAPAGSYDCADKGDVVPMS